MIKYKNIVIYGGSSEISKELINLYINECEKLTIFCRNKDMMNFSLASEHLKKIKIVEVELFNLEKILEIIKKDIYEISGLIWVAGMTGNAVNEYNDIDMAKKNIKINFFNPIMIINELSKKMTENNNCFIAIFTSVAGLRGRKKQLFYSAAKSGLIAYASGLRQKLNDKKIHVLTIIPGYMNTKSFREGGWSAPNFLISKPKKVAHSIKRAIEQKKEVIYINFLWKYIMLLVDLIPEKIFKQLKF